MASPRPSANEAGAEQASITSLSIFVALSAAMTGFLVSQTDFNFGYNAAAVACVSFMFAISVFLISLEFFIVAIFQQQHINYFGFRGACLYGVGLMCMIVGMSLTLKAFGMSILSYAFLSAMLLGYTSYYYLRWKKVGVESPLGWRIALRVIYFLLLGVGYLLLSTVGG